MSFPTGERTWTFYLEGCCLACVFLFAFVFGGLDQPLFATRWSCHFCFEILISFYRYVIYDLEGSNNMDPLVSGFGQIYLTVKFI
jgi:hypothetical protein